VASALKRMLAGTAALAAVGYLLAMLITGALPQQRQRVPFEAKGVMQLAPDRVARVELARGTDRAVFVRGPGAGWTREGAGPLAEPLAAKLSMAVQYMHTAGPVRVMAPAELRGGDFREFGLDRPVLSIALHPDSGPTLVARFGGRNPEDMLQYVAVEGHAGLFLMSRFVGQAWQAVADSAFVQR
jgi:hypothetical protein